MTNLFFFLATLLLTTNIALGKSQQCKMEDVPMPAAGGMSDMKKIKEDACKAKQSTLVKDEDKDTKAQCKKEKSANKACCCKDEQGGDNKKDDKGGGGGGSPPQMPQQQKKEEQPQEATSPTPDQTAQNSQPTPAEKPPATDVNKMGVDSKPMQTVVIGSLQPDQKPSTVVTNPGGPPPTAASRPREDNFGPNKNPPGAPAPAPGGTASGGGGGVGNSSGASQPGAQGAPAKGPNEANPYEINAGGGGKLGAPKGFSGGSDSAAADSAAVNNFNKDIGKLDPNAAGGLPPGEQTAPQEEDGYTLFKQITRRYVELKKKGAI